MKSLLILSVCVFLVPAGAAAQSQHPATQPSKSPPPSAATPTCGAHATPAQLEALRSDLKKMRSLLAQMQTNLAFVQNAPTPLKHQFELEIDMWRTLLEHMERNVGNPATEGAVRQHP
ncbi:MAG TPA: hypothetical protein VNK82_13110 [Terriglobales bacterium]|nr:hypothetical protein [Terriglobales bacterium]